MAVDPFFAKYGIPRHIAVAALPEYGISSDRPAGSAFVLNTTEWKILDGEGWKRQYRPGFTGVSTRVREAELAYLRDGVPSTARDVASTFLRNVCEPLREEIKTPHMSWETFCRTMEDYNAAMDLLDAFYIEHGVEM